MHNSIAIPRYMTVTCAQSRPWSLRFKGLDSVDWGLGLICKRWHLLSFYNAPRLHRSGDMLN